MSAKLHEELRKFDKQNSDNEIWIYSKFVETVLRSTSFPDAKVGLEFLLNRDYPALLDWADALSSAKASTAYEHRMQRQLAALVRKYPTLPGLAIDPQAEATKKFLAAEHRCSRVNRKFRLYSVLRSPHEAALAKARSWIHYVLGEVKLAEMWSLAGFGAGASLGIHGNCTNLARKVLSEEWTVTPGAYYFARAAMKDDMHIFELVTKPTDVPFYCVDPDSFNQAFGEKARLVEHNKISFVPKDAKTDRAIATEPLLNGYLQKGVDSYMRKRLKRVGYDLSDQTMNQEKARLGSIDWRSPDGYATIDLSSASDSISIELCRFLLPPDWFDLLNQLRSKSYELDGKVYTYQKFVSMGNGFCFPLETLLFASLCHAAGADDQPLRTSVYGDDIVIARSVFDRVIELLTICGFKANMKKTFSQGPFRESCGADWFEGEDVRPILLDFPLNNFVGMCKFWNGSKSKESWNALFSEGRDFLRSLVPDRLFLCRPCKGNPDTCFEVPWDVFMGSRYSRYSFKTRSWYWKELVSTAKTDHKVKVRPGYSVALIMGALRGALSSCPFSERFTARTNVRNAGEINAANVVNVDEWLRYPMLWGSGANSPAVRRLRYNLSH